MSARDLGEGVGRVLARQSLGLDTRGLEAQAGPPPLRVLPLDGVGGPGFNLNRLNKTLAAKVIYLKSTSFILFRSCYI